MGPNIDVENMVKVQWYLKKEERMKILWWGQVGTGVRKRAYESIDYSHWSLEHQSSSCLLRSLRSFTSFFTIRRIQWVFVVGYERHMRVDPEQPFVSMNE